MKDGPWQNVTVVFNINTLKRNKTNLTINNIQSKLDVLIIVQFIISLHILFLILLISLLNYLADTTCLPQLCQLLLVYTTVLTQLLVHGSY